MTNLGNPTTPPTKTPESPNAAQMLKDFLTEHNMEIRLSAPMIRNVDGAGLLIEQPQVLVDFKKITSIKN